jgi:hypothetical protein
MLARLARISSRTVLGTRSMLRNTDKSRTKSEKRRKVGARKGLKRMVAGGGFEPPTFGL